MKLQHLPIGARFEYEGEIFVKTGPLTASSQNGGQRIIPRYALLTPLEVAEPEPSKSGVRGRVEAVRVRTAFDRFYERCAALIGEEGQSELADARNAFLEAIK